MRSDYSIDFSTRFCQKNKQITQLCFRHLTEKTSASWITKRLAESVVYSVFPHLWSCMDSSSNSLKSLKTLPSSRITGQSPA